MGREVMVCDVLVVGGGAAGVSAAVRAGREGMRAVLIEKGEYLGGVGVRGMHRFICGLYANGEDPPKGTLNAGLAEEVSKALVRRAPHREVRRVGRVYVLPVAREDLVATFGLLSERAEGLRVLYNTRAVNVGMDGGRIVWMTVRGARSEFDIVPGAVVDCSGDGVVVQMSGAGHETVPADQRQLAGYTFRVERLRCRDGTLPVRVPYYMRKGVEEKGMAPYLRFTTYVPGDDPEGGYCKLNVVPWGEDSDERARRDAEMVHSYLSQVLAPFGGSRIAEMSTGVAHRDGVRVHGEYTLTTDDVLGGRHFSDGAVKSAWPIELWDQERGPSWRYLEPGRHYEIPLRCLKVRHISNCWCAGRCISATHDALGSTRAMGTCISLGEQAGREAACYMKRKRATTLKIEA